MFKKVSLIVAFGIFSVSAHAQKVPEFFSGYVDGCNQSEVYEKFQKDLCVAKNNQMGIEICEKGKLSLPTNVKASAFSMEQVDGGDFLFNIPLEQEISFGGNTVVAIEQRTNNAIGVWSAALVVKESDVKKVKENFKNSGIKFKSTENPVLGKVQTQIIKDEDKKVKLVCDLSN